MEVTVRIDNRKVYDSFVQFIRSIGITVVKEVSSSEDSSGKKKDYPLAGTVGRYEDPFGPAMDPNDWDVLR